MRTYDQTFVLADSCSVSLSSVSGLKARLRSCSTCATEWMPGLVISYSATLPQEVLLPSLAGELTATAPSGLSDDIPASWLQSMLYRQTLS